MLTGIALLPDAATRRDLVAFQRGHGSQIAGPSLGTEENLPHMSVLQCHFDDALDRDLVLDALVKQLSKSRRPLVMGELVYQPRAWIFAEVRRDPWLVELQGLALELTEHSIDLTMNSTRPSAEMSPEERTSYLRYGYRYVGPAFMPHITLGRTPDSRTGLAAGLVDDFRAAFTNRSVPAVEVAFYRAGESGAFAERLASRLLD